MSKNKPNPTTTAPVLEDAAEQDNNQFVGELKVEIARASGFDVVTDTQGNPASAKKGEATWEAKDGSFTDWVRSVQGEEKTLVQHQVANARSMGFEVVTDEAGVPTTAQKGEFLWESSMGDFMAFVKETMDALTAIENKVATTAQGPQGDGPLDNPHMRDAFYGTPTAPTGDLNVEVNENQVKTEPTLGMDVRVVPKEPTEAIKEDGVQLSAFATRMAWIEAHGTTHEQYVKNVMENYVKVGLTSVDLEKIAVEQKRLWRLFAYIHAHPQEFSKLFNIVLEFGREYREQLFNLHMLYRAQEGLALGADEMQCFNNLRTLVLNTIESKSRKAVKSILDVRKIVEHNLIPEHVRGLYVAFYM